MSAIRRLTSEGSSPISSRKSGPYLRIRPNRLVVPSALLSYSGVILGRLRGSYNQAWRSLGK